MIYARGARCSSLIYRFTPPRTPSVAPGDAHDAPRYRHTGMDCVFMSAREPLYMLITIVCSTIRLKCTFINRIHRGYLSGCAGLFRPEYVSTFHHVKSAVTHAMSIRRFHTHSLDIPQLKREKQNGKKIIIGG